MATPNPAPRGRNGESIRFPFASVRTLIHRHPQEFVRLRRSARSTAILSDRKSGGGAQGCRVTIGILTETR